MVVIIKKQHIGYSLIASPFVALFIFGWYLIGFVGILSCFLLTVLIYAIIFGGMSLIETKEDGHEN